MFLTAAIKLILAGTYFGASNIKAMLLLYQLTILNKLSYILLKKEKKLDMDRLGKISVLIIFV
jgi:hypothetical protein